MNYQLFAFLEMSMTWFIHLMFYKFFVITSRYDEKRWIVQGLPYCMQVNKVAWGEASQKFWRMWVVA